MSLLGDGVFREQTGRASGVDRTTRPKIFGSEPTMMIIEAEPETTDQDDADDQDDSNADQTDNNEEAENNATGDGNNGDGNNEDSDDDDDKASDKGPFRSELKLTSTLGFDSNIDESAGGRTSTVLQNNIEVAAEYQQDGLFWRLEGEVAHEQSLRFADEHSLDFAVAAQAGIDLSNGFRASSGLGLIDDRTSSDGTLTSTGFVELAHASDNISAALRGTAEFKIHPDQLDDDENSFANELNYTNLSVASEIKLLPKARVSPYLRLGASNVAFVNSGDLNRDSQNLTTTVGISAQILGNLRLDIGGRFDAREVSSSWHTDSFLDANLAWNPTDEFELTASVKREFEEIEDTDGYFVDVKTYAVELNWSPTSDLELSLAASLSDERNFGGLTESMEYLVEAEGLYTLNDNIKIVLASSMKMAEEQDEDEIQSEYEQFTVRSGLEVSF